MASNASRGATAKAKSKRFLERLGLTVFDMEIQRVVYTPNGMLPTKRDQLGADLGYLDVANARVVFVQVKSGMKPRGTLLADAAKGFAKYRWPENTKRFVHIWRFRARAPEVIACP